MEWRPRGAAGDAAACGATNGGDCALSTRECVDALDGVGRQDGDMTSTSSKPSSRAAIVTGLFPDRASAEHASRVAFDLGYASEDLTVVMSDRTREEEFAGDAASGPLDQDTREHAEAAARGSKLGGPAGGTAATIGTAAAAAGVALLIPGIVAAGPVVAALVAAGAAGVAGGLAGALADWGVPAERIEEYEADIRRGGILLGLEPASADHARTLERAWRAAGGRLVHR